MVNLEKQKLTIEEFLDGEEMSFHSHDGKILKIFKQLKTIKGFRG